MHSSGTLLFIICLGFLALVGYVMMSHGVGVPPPEFFTSLGGGLFALFFVFLLFALVRSLVKARRR